MVQCPVCYSTFPTTSYLLTHIRLLHADQPNFQIQCNLQGCKRTFRKFSVYRNHIYQFHDTREVEEEPESPRENTEINATDHSHNSEAGDDEQEEEVNCTGASSSSYSPQEQLMVTAGKWVLKISENHKMTDTAMDTIISDVQSFFEIASRDILKSALERAEVTTQEENVKILSQLPADQQSIFNGLETSYKRQQFYKKQFDLVEPVKVVVGSKLKSKGYNHKRRLVQSDDILVYVPVLATLQKMLENETVMSQVKRSPHQSNNPELLTDFCDGEMRKSHPLFSKKESLQIMIYYDDVEVCNPLGSKRKIHKIGVFYFTLGNLPPKFRSKFTAIQLAIICKKQVIDEYGMDKILRPLVDDIKKLETGYEFMVEGVKEIFYGSIALVSADNPASSALGGFKEGSSAYRNCRQCLGKSSMTTKEFDEAKFKLRTRNSHLRHCNKVEENIENSKKYGVNRRSCLLELSYFDPCCGSLLPDVMHDVLEGVLQYEAKLMLQHFVEQKYFSAERLSTLIESFELGYMEAGNRPTVITANILKSKDNRLSQNASQMWLLGRLIPVMLGQYISEDDLHWKCYLLMLQVTELLLAPEISKDEIGYLGVLIRQHHEMFVEVYPNASVIPKMHFLIHTARLILFLGPLVRYWTMRYEAKHSYLKRLSQNLGNFINIPWTLASHHQKWQCYKWMDDEPLGQVEPEISPGKVVTEQDIPTNVTLMPNEVFETKWAKVDGVQYKPQATVVLGVEDDYPVFGYIERIFIINNQVHVYVEVMLTTSFNDHYHVYILKHTGIYKTVLVSHLFSPIPLHIRRLTISQSPHLCVIPKFHISGTVQS